MNPDQIALKHAGLAAQTDPGPIACPITLMESPFIHGTTQIILLTLKSMSANKPIIYVNLK